MALSHIFAIILGIVIGQFFLGYLISVLKNLNKPMGQTAAQTAELMKKAGKEGYAHRVLVALDIFTNVICGGLEDETISSRVRRVTDAHPGISWNPGVWLAKVINGWLDVIQPGHGQHAQAGDLERTEVVEKTEDAALGVKL